jgi:hypothetical protein
MAALTISAQQARKRTMLIPREHGAWGMLLIPLATGAVVGSRLAFDPVAPTLFVVATLSLFWLRTPVEAWLGLSPIKAQTGEERRSVMRMIIPLCIVSVVSLGLLLLTGRARGLLIIGTVAAVSFAVQVGVKRLGRSGRMPAQIIGAVGLTSTAAGAYYVASGVLDKTAVLLWFANWLFAADQIHFVQIRIRGSKLTNWREKADRGKWFVYAQIALMVVLAVACVYRLLPLWAWIAFVPAFGRGIGWFVRPTQPLDVHKLGFSELRQSLLFGALLAVTFLA